MAEGELSLSLDQLAAAVVLTESVFHWQRSASMNDFRKVTFGETGIKEERKQEK